MPCGSDANQNTWGSSRKRVQAAPSAGRAGQERAQKVLPWLKAICPTVDYKCVSDSDSDPGPVCGKGLMSSVAAQEMVPVRDRKHKGGVGGCTRHPNPMPTSSSPGGPNSTLTIWEPPVSSIQATRADKIQINPTRALHR